LRIVDELNEKIFQQSSDFLNKLATEWNSINHNLLNDYGQNNYESSFINVLTGETRRKLPNYIIIPSFGLKALPPLTPEECVENALRKPLLDIRKELCEDYSEADCRSKQCFNGEYSSSEIDGLIIRDKDFCLLEYEESRKSLCNNFLKFYHLRLLLDKPFESLFVTKVTTKIDEGSTTFERFNRYIDNIRPMLNTLLQNWRILEIVDFQSQRRHFHWIP
jgi:hypothetical protein